MIHDAKPAMLAFTAHGWELRGLDTDTVLAAYLARPDNRTYDLTDLALRYLQRELRIEEVASVPADAGRTGLGLADENAGRAEPDAAGSGHARPQGGHRHRAQPRP